ncbi:MAG: N-acetylmuramoyl-L-alanine amidase [Selenomonas ruminantium]|nr:N-acetylmuramoyl-L-alanine amidase [Selenomonas ruminantium]
MKVFINAGHDRKYDSGAVNPDTGLREADVAANVAELVKGYLEAAGCECQSMQSDNLAPTGVGRSDHADRQGLTVTETANAWGADVFVSIHCNAFNESAHGTEVECYGGGAGAKLAQCIQDQIVDSLGTLDRGVREMPQLLVLKYTDMTAVLVEMAFIDNAADAELLANKQDEFARAIARGVTDYECSL